VWLAISTTIASVVIARVPDQSPHGISAPHAAAFLLVSSGLTAAFVALVTISGRAGLADERYLRTWLIERLAE
jgi:hypothetical protein